MLVFSVVCPGVGKPVVLLFQKTSLIVLLMWEAFSLLFAALSAAFPGWSWRESNPRPHEETIRFLHAYSRLHFRAPARPGPPTDALSPKISCVERGIAALFPICLRRWVLRFGTTPLERRLVLSPGDGIKPVIYCTSIRQREHTHCCQLIVCSLCFRR